MRERGKVIAFPTATVTPARAASDDLPDLEGAATHLVDARKQTESPLTAALNNLDVQRRAQQRIALMDAVQALILDNADPYQVRAWVEVAIANANQHRKP